MKYIMKSQFFFCISLAANLPFQMIYRSVHLPMLPLSTTSKHLIYNVIFHKCMWELIWMYHYSSHTETRWVLHFRLNQNSSVTSTWFESHCQHPHLLQEMWCLEINRIHIIDMCIKINLVKPISDWDHFHVESTRLFYLTISNDDKIWHIVSIHID